MSGGHLWYDRDGQPISVAQWERLRGLGEIYLRVALTDIGEGEDAVRVSTVWLGLDHNWTPSGPPLIFETMIFGGPLDTECWRWPTTADAQRGHDEAVRLVMLERAATMDG